MKLKKIKRLLIDTSTILSKRRLSAGQRLHFLFDYWKVNIMGFLNGKIAHYEQIRFLGFVVTPVSFSEFVMLVHEVFVDEPYFFTAKNDRPHIVDCGGNIGMSVLYFKWLYPESSVMVFEPSPTVCVALQKNVTDNNLSNVTVVEKALSDEEGSITFYLREGMTLAGTVEANESYGSTECEVAKTRLSNYITSDVDFMKIDVQFSEQRIFADLAQHGSWKYVHQLIMEFHHVYGYDTNSFAKTLASLEQSDMHYFLELNSKKSNVFASYIVRAERVPDATQTST